jgi:hypothetical protein
LQRAQLRKPPSDPRLDVLVDGLQWMQDYVNKALGAVLTQEQAAGPVPAGVDESPDGYRVRLGRTDISVRFGDIRTCDAETLGRVVALPANEFFDDECVNDHRSSLGAYIQHAFGGRIPELQAVIADRLRKAPFELVERKPNEMHKSYGVARCVYLESPLSSGRRIILTSITTQRPGIGLRSEARYLFAGMKAIVQEMNDHRLSDLTLPIMGSGHGGVEPELALLYLLLSCKAVIDDPQRSGAHVRSVTIVVFRKDSNTPPAIQPHVVQRILTLVKGTR